MGRSIAPDPIISLLDPAIVTWLTCSATPLSGVVPVNVTIFGQLMLHGEAGAPPIADPICNGETIEIWAYNPYAPDPPSTAVLLGTTTTAPVVGNDGYYEFTAMFSVSGNYAIFAYYAGSVAKNLEGCIKENSILNLYEEEPPDLLPIVIAVTGIGLTCVAVS